MYRNFSFVPNCQRRARKRFILHRRLNHIKRRLQLGFASHIHRRQLHRLGSNLNSKSRFQTNPRNRYRQMSANRNLSEQRARHRNLRHVADSKRAEPRFRLRKSFNQIRTAQRQRNHRLSRFVNLFRQRRLVRGNIHISFAIAHAHKQR